MLCASLCPSSEIKEETKVKEEQEGIVDSNKYKDICSRCNKETLVNKETNLAVSTYDIPDITPTPA